MNNKKEMIILLLVFALISNIYAQEINLICPDNVKVGEEFGVQLSLNGFETSVYDVKLEILNGTRNIAQRFWDGSWKSTNYWMYDIINTSLELEKNIKVKIVNDYNGDNNIKVKIKNENFNEEFEGCSINIGILNNSENNASNSSNNNSNPSTNPLNNSEDDEISISLEWDEEDIVNGEEFEINVKIENMEEENYDLKIWMEFEDEEGEIVSERYDEENEEWKSGNYYVNEFFEGDGDDSKDIKLRIRSNYEDYEGDGVIFAKIKETGKSNIIEEAEEDIEIIEKDKDSSDGGSSNSDKDDNDAETDKSTAYEKNQEFLKEKLKELKNNGITGQAVIDSEGTENIKTDKSLVYLSKTEKIKKYSLFGFAFLCITLIGLLIAGKVIKNGRKNKSNIHI